MDHDQQQDQTDDRAAATVARREVTAAVGELAASSLDEPAADRMREVFATSRMRRLRAVLIRTAQQGRTQLSVVTDDATSKDPEDEDRATVCGAALSGGAA